MTVKAAKGLEWDHVCLVNVFSSISKVDGASKAMRHMMSVKGPVTGSVTDCPGLEYLLKALYVAITRCKSRLTLVEVVTNKSSRDAIEVVNSATAWMRRTGIARMNTTPLRLGGDHCPSQRVADACDIMWRLENNPDEDRDTLIQWVDNARRGFSVGNRPDLARAADTHLKLMLSVRDSPVLSSKIDTPLTEDDKVWEEKMTGLTTDCLEVGLIRQIRQTMDSVCLYGMQTLNHVACERRQQIDYQRSEFDRKLLHMVVDKDTLDDAVREAQDRLRKLQELQNLRNHIVHSERFVGLMND